MVRLERGAAAVETAILSIFLVTLLMGMIDVGRAIFTRIAVEDAAQSGASFAAFADPVSLAAIEAVVIGSIDSPDLSGATITIQCPDDPSGDRTAQYVEVAVEYTQSLITPAISIFTDEIMISASATSERFAPGQPCP